MTPRIAVFIGTRPEAIKLAPVIAALREAEDLEPVVVSTGQHRQMLDQIVEPFGISIDHDLAVMRPEQSLAELTARLLQRVDRVLARVAPAMALVQGDTTTVLGAALACFYAKVPVGHVEAGLRTGSIDAPFPEELNRSVVTRLASLHFAPTQRAREQLLREGVAAERIVVTGNTGVDALQAELERQRDPDVQASLARGFAVSIAPDWDRVPYVLVTAHRFENFQADGRHVCDALQQLSVLFPTRRFIYPVHLNPRVREPVYARLGRLPNIRLIPPTDYREFVALLRGCRAVLTDSGGVQEEAPVLGKPVLVMRDATERPEGIEVGAARLVGTDAAAIVDAVGEVLSGDPSRPVDAKHLYGDGRASGRIVDAIRRWFEQATIR